MKTTTKNQGEAGREHRAAPPTETRPTCELNDYVTGYDRVERVEQVRQFFETDWENAEGLTDFFDG